MKNARQHRIKNEKGKRMDNRSFKKVEAHASQLKRQSYRSWIMMPSRDKTIEKPRFRRNPPLKIFASLETLFLFGQGPEVTWPEAASTKYLYY